MADITLSIHQSSNLDDILNQTVTQVRKGLDLDRVCVYCFEPDWSGIIVAESVLFPWKAIFGEQIKDPCLTKELLEQYFNGRVQKVEDVYQAQLHPCHLDVLTAYQVRSNLVLGIVAEDKLWGLFIAQHCRSPKRWQNKDIQMLKNIVTHLGIAIHQVELHEKMTCFNNYLEVRIKERMAKLKQNLQFEELIRNLTEKIRYSLDETVILSTLTQELAEILCINDCKIELYDSQDKISTIVYEYTHNVPSSKSMTVSWQNLPNFYQRLWSKQTLQIVPINPIFSCLNQRLNRLICPIFDDRGVLGNLWIIRPSDQIFNDLEIEFVQQLAAQCAIAIRQARLYQKSRSQIEELEKLNQIKDDFLKTISHELKTPMSSIMVGIQTLNKILNTKNELWNNQHIFHKVFQIIYQASQQQKQLVDDLLSLCYLDAKKEIVDVKSINIQQLINLIVKPFEQSTQKQRQKLMVNMCVDLGVFRSDQNIIKRILTELLNNACKYTPTQQTITLSISHKLDSNAFQFTVANSGVEISAEEQDKIFDKLYRIPNNDPWSHGGTGLGLTLVKKLVQVLQGEIIVISENQLTQFIVTIPNQK